MTEAAAVLMNLETNFFPRVSSVVIESTLARFSAHLSAGALYSGLLGIESV